MNTETPNWKILQRARSEEESAGKSFDEASARTSAVEAELDAAKQRDRSKTAEQIEKRIAEAERNLRISRIELERAEEDLEKKKARHLEAIRQQIEPVIAALHRRAEDEKERITPSLAEMTGESYVGSAPFRDMLRICKSVRRPLAIAKAVREQLTWETGPGPTEAMKQALADAEAVLCGDQGPIGTQPPAR